MDDICESIVDIDDLSEWEKDMLHDLMKRQFTLNESITILGEVKHGIKEFAIELFTDHGIEDALKKRNIEEDKVHARKVNRII